MATGWDPNRAEVVIGTSTGAFVAAMVRGDRLDLDAFIGDGDDWHDVADRLRRYVYRRGRPRGVARWVRRGVLPGLRRPDLTLSLGSPALYRTDGMVEWISDAIGPLADTWPDRPTVIVGYDLAHRRRAPFGTEAAPAVSLKEAVGASVAVPFLFEPVQIGDRWYADGGVASGTSADLLLGNPDPLDLVIVVAPLAAVEARDGARFYEGMFDRAGRLALAAELEEVHRRWPRTDVLVLRPDQPDGCRGGGPCVPAHPTLDEGRVGPSRDVGTARAPPGEPSSQQPVAGREARRRSGVVRAWPHPAKSGTVLPPAEACTTSARRVVDAPTNESSWSGH
jgi:NTE family protein